MKRSELAVLALTAILVGAAVWTLPAGSERAAPALQPNASRGAPAQDPAATAVPGQPTLRFPDPPYIPHAPPIVDRMAPQDDGRPVADFVVNGDDRSPPIDRTEPVEDLPAAQDMATPAAYSRWQQRRHDQRMQAQAAEANAALRTLNLDIERARAAGMSADKIEEARDKAAHLEAAMNLLQAPAGESPPPDPSLPAAEPPTPP